MDRLLRKVQDSRFLRFLLHLQIVFILIELRYNNLNIIGYQILMRNEFWLRRRCLLCLLLITRRTIDNVDRELGINLLVELHTRLRRRVIVLAVFLTQFVHEWLTGLHVHGVCLLYEVVVAGGVFLLVWRVAEVALSVFVLLVLLCFHCCPVVCVPVCRTWLSWVSLWILL